jgi:NADPH-dependent F420 reductase
MAPTIAIVGGSGPEGRGLALRFAMAGYSIVIGSRDESRGAEAAKGLLEIKPGLPITGGANVEAADRADWVLLSVPFDGLRGIVEELAPQLAGKHVMSVVAPMVFEGGQARAVVVPEGSAAELVAGLLPTSAVTSAFQSLSARELLKADGELEGDVAVCGDDEGARRETVELARSIKSLRGVEVGGLANSRYVEDLTALLVNINRLHKAHSTIRFVGI